MITPARLSLCKRTLMSDLSRTWDMKQIPFTGGGIGVYLGMPPSGRHLHNNWPVVISCIIAIITNIYTS